MGGEILVERRDGVAVLTVSDPQRRNALSLAMAGELVAAVRTCEADPSVGALVLTGSPPAFCAGADLDVLAAADEAGLRAVYEGFLAVAECPLPTLAAVNGPAVGAGMNLALAADLRLAAPDARFDARFLAIALHPGGGMTWLMQRAAGRSATAATALFGEVLDAAAALRCGLVWRVEPEVVAAAVELACRAAAAPRELVRSIKASIRATAATPSLRDAVEIEIGPQLAALRSEAFAERLAALRARLGRR